MKHAGSKALALAYLAYSAVMNGGSVEAIRRQGQLDPFLMYSAVMNGGSVEARLPRGALGDRLGIPP